MSKEKQIIEDMARISCNTNNSEIKWECAECPFNTVCDIQISCEALYNAGYRKQSEGEWIVKHTPLFKPTELICSNCQSLNGTRIKFNYCPNCGAKMKGGAE